MQSKFPDIMLGIPLCYVTDKLIVIHYEHNFIGSTYIYIYIYIHIFDQRWSSTGQTVI